MSALQAPLVAWIPETESEREWALLSAACPQVAVTMGRYLIQLRTFLAPRSVDAADNTMRQLARWLVAATDVTTVAGITRTHIEDYKVWLASQPGVSGSNMAKNTQRQRLRPRPRPTPQPDLPRGHPSPDRSAAQVLERPGRRQADEGGPSTSPAALSAPPSAGCQHRPAGARTLR